MFSNQNEINLEISSKERISYVWKFKNTFLNNTLYFVVSGYSFLYISIRSGLLIVLFKSIFLLFATKKVIVDLGWVPLKSHTEKSTWTEVIYMSGNPRNFTKGVEKVRQAWKEKWIKGMLLTRLPLFNTIWDHLKIMCSMCLRIFSLIQ